MTDAALSLPAAPATATPVPPRRGIGVVGPVLVLFAIASAIATFLFSTGMFSVEPTQPVVVGLLTLNAGFSLALIVLVGLEVGRLFRARRRGQAGAALQMRVTALFSIIAALPALLVALTAFITLYVGLDNLFSARVRSIVDTSVVIANAYVKEQSKILGGDALAMAFDLNRSEALYTTNPQLFQQYLKAQATFRGIPGTMLLTHDHQVTDRADIVASLEFPLPPPGTIEDADKQDIVMIDPGSKNVIGAVVKLKAFEDRYLFVVRPIDATVAGYLRSTQAGAEEYKLLEQRRSGMQAVFALTYVLIALIMLLSAIWIGLAFATRLVEPIRNLIDAANEVAAGNLAARVTTDGQNQDLARLGNTFNTMTDTLATQRADLVGANELLDARRLFMEAVLSGVSTGVIGIDREGRVTVVNPHAEQLLRAAGDTLAGKALGDEVPELQPFIADAMLADAADGRSRLVQGQVTLRPGGRERIVTVRVTSEQSGVEQHGYVVTLDDITELVTAQRSSAWADVARRIAHEIKNPLTPIQLSAERIKRKYGRVITQDKDVFDQCTDTIVRQVEDIKRMVDEFSSFARMPKPMIEPDDLGELAKQVVFLMRVGNPEVEIAFEEAREPVVARFDRRLLSQALTNIVKNAVEATQGVPEAERGQPRVEVSLVRQAGSVAVDVTDNGIGLPTENRQRLLEPYVTTREKGTGLGLAIVGKIMEDHGGGIELLDAPAVAEGGRGARIRLWFPAAEEGGVGKAA